jgi:hypothetical protein
MKRTILTLLVAKSALLSASAQCYDVTQVPFYPFPFINGTPVSLSDDSHSGVVPIGFNFCYFGQDRTELVISSNGYITFDLSYVGQYSPWSVNGDVPNVNAPREAILGPWQDINPGLGGQIVYATYGLAPYRKFVVSYYDVPMFSCTNLLFRNQIVLYETLNIIDINIANKELCGTWGNGAAVEGITGPDSTEAYVVPGRNASTQWTSTGDCYRFIPQCYCAAPADMAAGNVAGSTYWDYDQDCTQDVGEPGMPNVRFDVQPGNGTVWSGYQGNIGFMADPGAITMQFSSQNPWYMASACPAGPVAVNVEADSTVGPYDWGLDVIPYQDLVVSASSGWMATCFNSVQQIQLCNNGNIPAQNVVLSATLPSFLLDVSTSLPATTNGDTLTWTFPWVGPGECVSVQITDSVDCDPNLLGQLGCVSAWASTDTSESDVANNMDQSCMTVAASYDPNAIHVRVADQENSPFVSDHLITSADRLEYIVHFQNTGNAPAYNVSVHVPLSGLVETTSIVPGAASHICTPHIDNGVLIIDYPAIILPDSLSDPAGSQGWFRFTVDQVAGNGPGTDIAAGASIYFDNNPAVDTDTAHSVILMVGMQDHATAPVLMPNPTDGQVRLTGMNGPIRVDVCDVNGRVVYSSEQTLTRDFDLSALEAGVYVLRAVGPAETLTERLIIH